jgi:hypothetical protein
MEIPEDTSLIRPQIQNGLLPDRFYQLGILYVGGNIGFPIDSPINKSACFSDNQHGFSSRVAFPRTQSVS